MFHSASTKEPLSSINQINFIYRPLSSGSFVKCLVGFRVEMFGNLCPTAFADSTEKTAVGLFNGCMVAKTMIEVTFNKAEHPPAGQPAWTATGYCLNKPVLTFQKGNKKFIKTSPF